MNCRYPRAGTVLCVPRYRPRRAGRAGGSAAPAAAIEDVLDRAKRATAVLAGKAEPSEAAAYGHWLVTIADAVVSAARSGGVLGIGGELVTDAERRFVDRLSQVLHD